MEELNEEEERGVDSGGENVKVCVVMKKKGESRRKDGLRKTEKMR